MTMTRDSGDLHRVVAADSRRLRLPVALYARFPAESTEAFCWPELEGTDGGHRILNQGWSDCRE